MKKFAKKFAVLVALAGISTAALAGCGSNNNGGTDAPAADGGTSAEAPASTSKYTTVVAGTSEMNGVFSPLFYTTAYDKYVWQYTQARLLKTDRNAEPVSGLADFNVEEVKNDAGEVEKTVYTFTLKDGITFSDGEAVTADDVLFTYKVYCDPTYDGMGTIHTLPIIGINEYRYDDPNYASKVEEIKVQSENITDSDVEAYVLTAAAGDFDGYGLEALVDYLGGVDGLDGLDDAAKKEKVVAAYAAYEMEKFYDDYKADAIDAKYKELEKAYIAGNLAGGEPKVAEVEGIKKIDDKTLEVTLEGVDPTALLKLGDLEIVPEHYYGVADDGTTWTKGDLTVVKSRNANPVGAGPYTFDKFENNVVSLNAYNGYYEGAPATPTIKLQVTSTANKLEAIRMGEMDITDPTASPQMVSDVEAAGLHYELIDNNGYGYIGINAERITDKNVRKGLMHLMNRKPAIETYYGELADIIERPITKVSWAYPQDATEYYGFDAAKALEYFQAAGYEQADQGGKKVLQKDGEQLKVEIGIGGDGTMDHPSAPILTQMKTEFEALGGILEINDTDSSILFERLNAGQWDMWVAAWGGAADPDMYQVYYSGMPSNHYRIDSEELNGLILAGRSTTDIEERKEIYGKALDLIMDEAIEMPVYQRKNMMAFNPEIVDVTSLPENPSPYYQPFYDATGQIQTLRLK